MVLEKARECNEDALFSVGGCRNGEKTLTSHMNGPRRLGPSSCRNPLLRSLTERGRRMNVGQRGGFGTVHFLSPPRDNANMTSEEFLDPLSKGNQLIVGILG